MSEPITIPASETKTVRQPVSLRLTAEQLAAIKAAITSAGVTFPDGISNIYVAVAEDLSASVRINFRS